MVERLGIEYEDLRATAWCLQGEVKRPVTMAKRERRGLIRRLLLGGQESSTAARNLGAKPADTVQKAQQEVKEARNRLEEATSGLKKAEAKESEARKRLDASQEQWKVSLERRSRHEVLLATIAGHERERDGLQEHTHDCVASLQEMREIENRAKRFDPSALDRATARLEKDLTQLDCLETELQDTRERRLIQNAAAEARSDWYGGVSDTLASAIARGQCSTCERRIRRGHSTLTKNLDRAKAAAEQFRLQSDNPPGLDETELSDEVRRLAREIDARLEHVSNLQYEHGYYEAAESLLHRISSQVAKHADLEGRLAEVVGCLAQRRQELDANGYREEEHVRLDAEVPEAEFKWREAREQVRREREEVDQLRCKCWKVTESALDASAKAVEDHMDEEKVRSELEGTMEELVRKLTCGDSSRPPLAVSVDKDFKPTLHEGDRSGAPVSSPGLDDMVALAMRLALLSLVRKKRPEPGSICDLVILDEPFGNVDSTTAVRFLELLLEDEKWRVRQVLEIGSGSVVEHGDSTTVCTVCVEDGTAKACRSTIPEHADHPEVSE